MIKPQCTLGLRAKSSRHTLSVSYHGDTNSILFSILRETGEIESSIVLDACRVNEVVNAVRAFASSIAADIPQQPLGARLTATEEVEKRGL